MLKVFATALAAVSTTALLIAAPARADMLMDELVEFPATIFFLSAGVPGAVVAVVKGDETAVYGFGETKKGSGIEPTGDSTIRIGSITKAFTGQVLAHAVAEGEVAFTTPAADHVSGELGEALKGVPPLLLIDLVTHSGGFPREVPRDPSDDPADPFATITYDAFAGWIAENGLLFEPGSAVLYSNFGFDILSAALSGAAGKPFDTLVEETITGPLGMEDTGYARSERYPELAMYGHGFDGEPLPHIVTGDVITGSGGLTTTANDMVKWMRWHLEKDGPDAEARLLDHAVYRSRGDFDMVSGMDESGRMSGMGLAWVAMNATEGSPFILQKAGGMQGELSYVALAPAHGVGVFVSINAYNFSAAAAMAEFANELNAELSGY
ncbi:D-alanyl-D-alanine-carboxypeptidase/endopeptidase AmpH [Martelella endophytica]|uniref:Beta-lactamase-related domain-containing protein n=1 Tax=Martelella endophytica TaxID=1486262 RepID=A0A0D5LSE7_MAREN|nr:D-alanyl-D-alanine-carboxypeptidase/endopeptidase AmpH [Martelella endophytica]AJY46702.1 hypothetical protein TM49_15100 [Martelella endophytica]